MKYIRTKDGIYEIDETTILTSLPPCYKVIKPTDKHYAISQKNVIKEADTIEELCDEFVLIDEENEHYIKQDNDIHHIRRKWAIGNYKVYGAIWTDKGLIYVAKLNKKGELELL